MTNEKILVYGDSISGNCYKIQLLCSQLGIRYDWQEVDILNGGTRTEAFLAMNANGKIPLLALPDDCYLAESNVIKVERHWALSLAVAQTNRAC